MASDGMIPREIDPMTMPRHRAKAMSPAVARRVLDGLIKRNNGVLIGGDLHEYKALCERCGLKTNIRRIDLNDWAKDNATDKHLEVDGKESRPVFGRTA